MSSNLLLRLNILIQRIEHALPMLFGRPFPPDAFCLAACPTVHNSLAEQFAPPKAPFSISDFIGDGILWAVPKHRRTIERRMKRKYGSPQYAMKILLPKQTLRVCTECGHDHEIGVLCPHCYDKIKTETKEMQAKIEEKLGLNPVEEEVVVLYEGERETVPTEHWKGKRIVEMPKTRPMWFSKNLVQKTTQQPATTKEIKPVDLG